jgi:glycosyltransferase involved in cell wall biosynthesis
MSGRNPATSLSVIVPVGARHAQMASLYDEYRQAVVALGLPFEFIFVLDGPRPQAADDLERLLAAGERITVVGLSRSFGEATALMAGFERTSGNLIVTLPAYHQIDAAEIGKLVATATDGADIAVGHRHPRAGGRLEAMRRAVFHRFMSSVTGVRLRDIGCSARALKRQVMEEVPLYGDLHRFLPVLADRQGFRVKEVDVRQSPKDRYTGVYRAKEYTHRLLDIFTVFFLVRFTKKPLRFFGMIGASTFGIGVLLLVALIIERIGFGQPLADRPALLLSSLLVVLGLQLFALGLLGELVIFTHARHINEYQIDQVFEFPVPQPQAEAKETRPLSA